MEISSLTGWLAIGGLAVFILGPILWFSIFRKRGQQ
jgi:hypothetical protein